MNLFKEMLSPRFQFVGSRQQDACVVHLGLEKDASNLDEMDRETERSQKKSQPLKLIPNSETREIEYLYDMPRRVFGLTHDKRPGVWHRSQVYGARLSALLLSQMNFSGHVTFHIIFSDDFKREILGGESAFLVGFLMRATPLKRSSEDLVKTVSWESIENTVCEEAQSFAASLLLTRTLINFPANILTPKAFADFASQIVESRVKKGHAQISCEVWDEDRLQQERCGLLMAVGSGSINSPHLVILRYKPTHSTSHVALVGKGITFDSGGLDLKGSSFMRNMKKDMGGAASVLGAFDAAVSANLDIELTCVLALAENMVSGQSMRPGDVYQARNGLTVEIDNTDAEGRLVLADAIDVAIEFNPNILIDIATLTGAARVATGPSIDAMFTNRSDLGAEIFELGVEVGDWVWPLPLPQDYDKLLNSAVADTLNSASSGHGGAITAALFLKKFVKGLPWIHIDSFMWTEKSSDLYGEPGPTSKCVQLVKHFLQKHSQADKANT